jgi:hypothetical protein
MPLFLVLGAALLALPATSFATTVTPTYMAGNPTCADLNAAWHEVKADPPSTATYTDGTLSVDMTVTNGVVDWSANFPIDAVIVKGGPNANIYNYSPNVASDSGLVTPPNGPTKNYGLSHVDFCYGPPDNPPPAGPNPPGTNPTDPGTTQVQGQTVAGTQTPGGGQIVLGERITPGTARLVGGATGCASKAFSVRVRGTKIASVRMTLDGKRLKLSRNAARIDPSKLRIGIHRIVATVRFQRGTGTKTRTLRLSFQRCGRAVVAPRFTG